MPSFGTLKADTLTHSTAGSLDTNIDAATDIAGLKAAWDADLLGDSPYA